MANRNSVPDRVSTPIPGFEETRRAWGEQYAREEARRRVIEADRWAYRRSQLNDQSAQARLLSDLNPLKVAGEMYAGEMAAGGLKAIGRTVFSGKMRPGYIRIPLPEEFSGEVSGRGGVTLNQTISDALRPSRVLIEQTVDRTPGARFGNTLYSPMGGGETSLLNPGKIVRHGPSPWNSEVEARIRDLAPKIPQPAQATQYRIGYRGRTITDKVIREFSSTPAPPTVVESEWTAPQFVLDELMSKYKASQEMIKKIYSDKDAVNALNSAFRTGNMDDPVMKLYRAAKEAYSTSRSQLDKYASAYAKGSEAAARSPTRPRAQMPPQSMSPDGKLHHVGSDDIARRISGKETFSEKLASVKPGTLWSDHIWPYVKSHPVKSFVYASIPTLTVASGVKMMAARKSQDVTTSKVKEELDPIKDSYLSLTNDAEVASAMSDASLLRRDLFRLRNTAVAELERAPDRIPSVQRTISDYLARVGQSRAMQELISRKEEEYRGFAQGDDFRAEFRSRYPDPLSRALGMDFYSGLLGGAR